MGDLRQRLLRLHFPDATNQALYHITQYFNTITKDQDTTDSERIIQELITEFVFYESSGYYSKKLSAIQELQLLEILCQYFEQHSNNSLHQQIFNGIFSGNANYRLNILNKLCSMAVGVKCVSVLRCTAAWIQAQEKSSPRVAQLISTIIDDYCRLIPGTLLSLQAIADACPLFACNLITALTSMYQMTGDASLNCPPHLMEIVTEWVFSKPSLALMSAIASPKHSATPIPGLIHWCVMAPVARVAADDGSADDSAAAQTLFSRLHLGVLQTMLRGQEIGMRHVILCEHFEHSLATLAAIPRDSVDAESLNMSLNRLGQALQVAKTTGLLSGDIAELVASTAALPHNRLLDIVLRDS